MPSLAQLLCRCMSQTRPNWTAAAVCSTCCCCFPTHCRSTSRLQPGKVPCRQMAHWLGAETWQVMRKEQPPWLY